MREPHLDSLGLIGDATLVEWVSDKDVMDVFGGFPNWLIWKALLAHSNSEHVAALYMASRYVEWQAGQRIAKETAVRRAVC